MGDVRTHAEISLFLKTQWDTVLPGQVHPGSFSFLELGNFLTDVSQVRDPPAHHHGRERFREGAAWYQKAWLFISGQSLDTWLNQMFGSRTGPRHGELAEFLHHIAVAAAHMIFATDGLFRRPALAGSSAFAGFRLIDPPEIDKVVNAHFTQYFPHEHLDFPEFTDGRTLTQTDLFQTGTRGLIGYLEWYLQYLSEQLSKLEYDWVLSLKAADQGRAQQSDFLVRLGHLLHAVEDYYFHSNFPEIRQWQRVGGQAGSGASVDPSGLLAGTRYDSSSVPLRRLCFRRLRYPVFATEKDLSRTASEPATSLLYTGGFSSTELWHTLGGALEAIEHAAAAVGLADRLNRSEMILIRLLFNEEARRAMVHGGDAARKANQATHKQQLIARQYESGITAREKAGELSKRAAEELQASFGADLAFERRYSDLWGPGGVLIYFLQLMQQERDGSRAAAAVLNANVSSMALPGSDDMASAERIGTHSLLSKDSPAKEPFRPDSVALAKHASASVALHLADRLAKTTDDKFGVDWDTVLRHYVRFPEFGSSTWEEFVLNQSDGSAGQPTWAGVPDRANYSLLGPSLQPDKLAARRAGTTTSQLEAYYGQFEQ